MKSFLLRGLTDLSTTRNGLKKGLIALLFLISLKSYGQDLSASYQQNRQQISNAESTALKAVFNSWATPNPLTPGHAYAACDGWPGAGYKCKAHNLQCCSKGCAEAYAKQKNSTEKEYQAKLDQADADYTQKNAAANKAKEAELAKKDNSQANDTQAQVNKIKNTQAENIKKQADINDQRQQQADSYLNKALYGSTNGIDQAYNFSTAGINAAAAGDKVKVQQIQQQSNQALINNVSATLNNLATMIQEKANKDAYYANRAASIKLFYDRKEIRTRLYNAIGFYSRGFLDKNYQFYTNITKQYDEDVVSETDELNIYNRPGFVASINELLDKKKGTEVAKYIVPPVNADNLMDVPFDIEHANAFAYKFRDAYKGYDFSGPVLKTLLIDDRSKKELKHPVPNDLREILPKLSAAYYAGDLNQFDSYFEIYKNSAEIKKGGQFYSNAFLQWLYEAKALLYGKEALKTKDRSKFITAFSQLEIADTIANASDYDLQNVKFHYDLSYFLNTATYWENLSNIRKAQFAILSQLYALPETSAVEKSKIDQAIVNIYNKTKVDMAPMFSDPELHSVPLKVNDKSN